MNSIQPHPMLLLQSSPALSNDVEMLQTDVMRFFAILCLCLMAIFALAAHYIFAAAFVRAEISVLAPFEYTMLLWTVAIGYLVWSDVPTTEMWTGAALIITAGIYVAHREALRRPDCET